MGSTNSAGAAAGFPAAATSAAVPSGTAAPAVVPPGLAARHEVDEVVEVALLLRAGRRIFAAHHADQPNVVGAVADHLERLHQTRQAILFDPELLLDLGGRERGARIRCSLRGRARLRIRRLRARFAVARFTLRGGGRLLCRCARLDSRLLGRSARLGGRLLRGYAGLGRRCFPWSFSAL
jgi:hypothetical protein